MSRAGRQRIPWILPAAIGVVLCAGSLLSVSCPKPVPEADGVAPSADAEPPGERFASGEPLASRPRSEGPAGLRPDRPHPGDDVFFGTSPPPAVPPSFDPQAWVVPWIRSAGQPVTRAAPFDAISPQGPDLAALGCTAPTAGGRLHLRESASLSRLRLGRLVGVVRRVDGTPVAGTTVFAVPEPGTWPAGTAKPDVDRRRTASTTEGQFEIAAQADVQYTLTAECEDFPPAVLHGARVDEDVTLWVVRYVSARVQVRDASGRPVDRAHVEAEPIDRRGGAVLQADSTDGDGLAELRGLVEGGAYRLTVVAPGSRPDLEDRHVEDWPLTDTAMTLLIRP